MAKFRNQAIILLLLYVVVASQSSNPSTLKICKFNAIYQLGDSISDTGNFIRDSARGAASPFARLPYGHTFFGNATGRCSDGRLIIDFFAKSAGLPLLNPYLKRDTSFKNGVNFAVVGSTALTPQYLAQNLNVVNPFTNSSLTSQLHSMSTYFNQTCRNHNNGCLKLKSSLFMIGEIGGNDVNYAFLQGKSMEDVINLVPQVLQTIKDAVTRVVEFGATRMIVPGNFPIGCIPIYLTAFQTNISDAYDQFKCLKRFNHFAIYYNNQLQQAIRELQQQNPEVAIVYGDYYNAFQYLNRLSRYPVTGFDNVESLQKACCGTGGDYDFNPMRMCGVPGVPVCQDPSRRISWDGIHFTERSYEIMSQWLISDALPKLQCHV